LDTGVRLPRSSHLRDTLSRDEGQSEEKVKTLEVALREFEAAGDRIPERKRQMLAMRFYLRDLFAACTDYMCSPELAGGVTNHVALLIGSWNGAVRQPNRRVYLFQLRLHP